jgi:hypothetical protein
MNRPSDTPSKGFSNVLQMLLREGTKKIIRIPCESKTEAILWRSRIHRLRRAMRRENHPDWATLYGAEVRLDRKDPSILVIMPVDYEFGQAITKALGEGFVPATETTLEDNFLKRLMEGKEKP